MPFCRSRTSSLVAPPSFQTTSESLVLPSMVSPRIYPPQISAFRKARVSATSKIRASINNTSQTCVSWKSVPIPKRRPWLRSRPPWSNSVANFAVALTPTPKQSRTAFSSISCRTSGRYSPSKLPKNKPRLTWIEAASFANPVSSPTRISTASKRSTTSPSRKPSSTSRRIRRSRRIRLGRQRRLSSFVTLDYSPTLPQFTRAFAVVICSAAFLRYLYWRIFFTLPLHQNFLQQAWAVAFLVMEVCAVLSAILCNSSDGSLQKRRGPTSVRLGTTVEITRHGLRDLRRTSETPPR
jgi:hypothetical protein